MFWALTKATLLVSGSSRMKPHSLCMGFRVSGWKALNLHGEQGEAGQGECRDSGPQPGSVATRSPPCFIRPPPSTRQCASRSRGNRYLGNHVCGRWAPGAPGLLPLAWKPLEPSGPLRCAQRHVEDSSVLFIIWAPFPRPFLPDALQAQRQGVDPP